MRNVFSLIQKRGSGCCEQHALVVEQEQGTFFPDLLPGEEPGGRGQGQVDAEHPRALPVEPAGKGQSEGTGRGKGIGLGVDHPVLLMGQGVPGPTGRPELDLAMEPRPHGPAVPVQEPPYLDSGAVGAAHDPPKRKPAILGRLNLGVHRIVFRVQDDYLEEVVVRIAHVNGINIGIRQQGVDEVGRDRMGQQRRLFPEVRQLLNPLPQRHHRAEHRLDVDDRLAVDLLQEILCNDQSCLRAAHIAVDAQGAHGPHKNRGDERKQSDPQGETFWKKHRSMHSTVSAYPGMIIMTFALSPR